MTGLVTGASSGIGLQYATILARDYHANLLLVSNQQAELMQTAADLHARYGILAQPLYMDLASADAADSIYDYCVQNEWQIDVLVNNAGFLLFGECIDQSPERIDTLIHLQVLTLTRLCRLFATDMAKREGLVGAYKGYILNMSSMTAWMPMPTIACYNASKSYILNFSKALWYELRAYQVTVCAVTPGAVDTPLYPLSNGIRKWAVRLGISLPPEQLAKRALRSLFKGKKWSMPGWINYLAVPVISHLPDWLVLWIMKKLRPIIKK